MTLDHRRSTRTPPAGRFRSVVLPRIATSRTWWARSLIVTVWAWALVPRILQSLLSPKSKAAVGLDTTPYDPIAKLSQSVLTVAVFFVCIMIVVLFVQHADSTGALALAMFLSPWVYLVLRDEVLNVRLHKSGLFYLLIAISVWILRPRLNDLAVLGYLVGVTALISIAFGVLYPAKGILNSASGTTVLADKQIIPGGILIGPFTDGNNLGQFLVIGITIVPLIGRAGWRRLMLVACVLALVWSASRSSLVALGAVLVAVAVLRSARPTGRGTFGAATVLAVGSAVVAAPLLTNDPSAFTDRGYIWQQSFTAWHADEVFGLGANWYSKIASTSASLGPTVFHAHNQFVQLLVIGGVVLAILAGFALIALTAAASRHATRTGDVTGITFLVAFLGACLLEVSYVLVDRDFLTPVMVVPAAFILFADRMPNPTGDAESDEHPGACPGGRADTPGPTRRRDGNGQSPQQSTSRSHFVTLAPNAW